MRLIHLALLVLALSCAPLIVAGTLDPSANPIGLDLLAMLGTAVAALLVAWAVVQASVRGRRS